MTTTGRHRNTQYRNLYCIDNDEHNRYILNDIEIVIAQLAIDNKWWIIPNYSRDESQMIDMGPYETLADAIVFCRLCCDKL